MSTPHVFSARILTIEVLFLTKLGEVSVDDFSGIDPEARPNFPLDVVLSAASRMKADYITVAMDLMVDMLHLQRSLKLRLSKTAPERS